MMLFFREIFELTRMLFRTHPSDFKDVKIISFVHFPFKGFIMMWCGKIVVRQEEFSKYSNAVRKNSSWLNHERIHLNQAQNDCFKDSWLRYYLTYFLEWLKGYPIINKKNGAYYTIPFEVEAYCNEDNQSYTVVSDIKNSKYNILSRVKFFKVGLEIGWKKFIKYL